MAIMDPLRRIFRLSPPAPLESRAAQNESMLVGMQANIPHWPKDDFDRFARDGYSRIPLVYACINAIATSAAEARIRPMVGDPKDRQELLNAPISQLLAQPRPKQGWYPFGVSYHTSMQYSGNCFIYKLRNAAGMPVQLRILRTGSMLITPGPNGDPIMYHHRVDGREYPIPVEDIIHVKREDPLDEWFGLSPLHVLARTVQMKVEMQEVQWGAFHNRGMMGGIVTLDRELDDDEPPELRRQWRRQFTGQQAGNVAFFGSSLKWQQVAMDLDKMAMPDLTWMTETEICGVFSVPPSVVFTMISETRGAMIGTGGAEKQDQIKFWDNCLNPEIRLLTEALETSLKVDFGGDWTLEADTSEVRALQDDEDATHLRVRADFEASIISRDEARVAMGYDKIGGRAGDTFVLGSHVTEQTLEDMQTAPPPPVLTPPPVEIHPADQPAPMAVPANQLPAPKAEGRERAMVRRLQAEAEGRWKEQAALLERRAAPTMGDMRDVRTRAYAAALLALWQKLQAGDITQQEYDAEQAKLVQTTAQDVRDGIAASYADVEPDDLATGTPAGRSSSLLGKAATAAALGAALFLPDTPPPSDAMAEARANQAAGAIWAYHTVLEGEALGLAQPDSTITGTWNAQNDDATCPECEALDGTEFGLDDAPIIGEACAGDGNCRCEIDWSCNPGDELQGGMRLGGGEE